jgi:hypothetical protein
MDSSAVYILGVSPRSIDLVHAGSVASYDDHEEYIISFILGMFDAGTYMAHIYLPFVKGSTQPIDIIGFLKITVTKTHCGTTELVGSVDVFAELTQDFSWARQSIPTALRFTKALRDCKLKYRITDANSDVLVSDDIVIGTYNNRKELTDAMQQLASTYFCK